MIVKDKKEITSFLAGDHTQIQEILHPKNDPVDLKQPGVGYSGAWETFFASYFT
jgi:hypothetical protein